MKKIKIPKSFRPILWSYDISKLDAQKHKRTIIFQAVNYGDWEHWKWMVKTYGFAIIRKQIKDMPVSQFRSSALDLAMVVFDIKKMNYASRSAYIKRQKSLAKTR